MKTLYFIDGRSPTALDTAVISMLQGDVYVRTVLEDTYYSEANLEPADYVAGNPPAAYAAAYPYANQVKAELFGNVFCALGDSRTAGCFNTGATTQYLEPTTAIGWASIACQGRMYFHPEGDFGVGGDSTEDMLARIAAVIANPAKNVIVLGGVNDRGGDNLTLAQSKANMVAILEALGTAGKRVFLCSELPYESLTGTQLANHLAYRAWLSDASIGGALYRRPWVVPVDSWQAIADDSAENAWRTGDDEGNSGLHYMVVGAARVGLGALGPAIAAAVPYNDYARLAATAGDLYHATTNPTGVLSANALLAGTGGTKATGSSGNLADSFATAKSTPANNSTLAFTKRVAPDSIEWQDIVIAGTPDADDGRWDIREELDISKFATGDRVVAACLAKWDALVNIISISVGIEFIGSAGTYRSRTLDGYDKTRLFPASSKGVRTLVAPELVIPSGTITNVRQVITIRTGAGATACAGNVSFAKATPRKRIG